MVAESPNTTSCNGDRPMVRRLSQLGRSTLITETSTNLSIVVCAVVLESQITSEELKDMLRERLLRQHARYRSLVEGESKWVVLCMEEVDLDQHIRIHPLTDPNSREELGSVMGYWSGLPLSKFKPLWEVILIPEYQQGSALIFRQHHCLADGGGGAVVMDSLSDSPEQWIQQPGLPLHLRVLRVLALAITMLLSIPFLIYSIILTIIYRDGPSPLKPEKLQGGRRKVGVSEPLDLEIVRRVSRALDCKINDLALTLFSRALHDQAKAADPSFDKPVWAGIPVDMRDPGEMYVGNKFGFGACRLPVHLEEFSDVLKYVKHQTGFMKGHHLAQMMYYFSLISSTVLPTAVLRAMLGYCTGNISVVISNVAAGSKPLIFKGHPTSYVFSLVPPPPSVGLGCSVVSHRDKVVFAVVADAACTIDPVAVVEYIANTIRTLSVEQQEMQGSAQ